MIGLGSLLRLVQPMLNPLGSDGVAMRAITVLAMMALAALTSCAQPNTPPSDQAVIGDNDTPAASQHAVLAAAQSPAGPQMGVFDTLYYASVYGNDYPYGQCARPPYYTFPYSACFGGLFLAHPFFFGFGTIVALNNLHLHHTVIAHHFRLAMAPAALRGMRR